ENESRKLNIGFASGRFDFSNRHYGIVPRNEVEKKAWAVVKGKILCEATEIFLRLLKGEKISRADVPTYYLEEKDFRKKEDWEEVYKLAGKDRIPIAPFWNFERVGIIPTDVRLDLLQL